MANNKVISVGDDFHIRPSLRYSATSENSGEDFYHKVLNMAFADALEHKVKLTVNLDTAEGYAISFLDESFGNLVYDFGLGIVSKNIEIISNDEPHWKEKILNEIFLKWEDRRQKNERPKVTKRHNSWYRMVDHQLILEEWETPSITA